VVVSLWRCRLCNAIETGPATHATPEAEIDARIAAPTKAARISRHVCKGGAHGVTDLVGATDITEESE